MRTMTIVERWVHGTVKPGVRFSLFCSAGGSQLHKREKSFKREKMFLGAGGFPTLPLRNPARLPRPVSVGLGGTISARALVE